MTDKAGVIEFAFEIGPKELQEAIDATERALYLGMYLPRLSLDSIHTGNESVPQTCEER